MIKKAIAAGTVLAVLATVWVVDPGGHVSTMFGYVSENFEPSLEYQIRRAEKLIKKLEPSIAGSEETLARNKVTLEKLKEDLVELKAKADMEHGKLVAMRKRVGNGEQLVSLNEATRGRLQRQFKRTRIAANILKSTQQRHDALEKHYVALRDKVIEMREQKEVAMRALEAKKAALAAVQVDELHAKQVVDDSEFAEVLDLLENIDTEIMTRRELVNMRSGDYGQETEEPAAPVSSSDTLDEIDAYLQSNDGPRVAGK